MPKRVVPEGEGRRVPVMTRTTPEMRERLESAASASGRSLGQEVEYRLELSFLEKDLVERVIGAEHTAAFVRDVVTAASLIETYAERRWNEDRYTRTQVAAAIARLMASHLFDDHPEAIKALQDLASLPDGPGIAAADLVRGELDAEDFKRLADLNPPRHKYDAAENPLSEPTKKSRSRRSAGSKPELTPKAPRKKPKA